MADGRHFENAFITISQPRIIRFQGNLVCHCILWLMVTWQSIKILQIQNGGRPPYWKSFLAISRQFIVRLKRNLIWRNRITFRYRSHDQNTKIWKFKMADDRHFENGFITISQLHADHPISMKFGVPLHKSVPRSVTY